MNNSGKTGRSFSWTSKANHSQIINDNYIKSFLNSCKFPKKPDSDSTTPVNYVLSITSAELGNRHILTVDGSYTLVRAKKEFPSSEIAFFQFGAICFELSDLDALSTKPFIAPEDIKKLHNLSRSKLALPVKNVTSDNQTTLNDSIRHAIYRFFLIEKDSVLSLMDTLSWLLFEEYSDTPTEEYVLANDPNLDSDDEKVTLKKSSMRSDFTFIHNGRTIYLTDVFRLHEVIDEDFGAAGILGYVSRLIEQLLLIRYLHLIYKQQPKALSAFIFITNGPLSFSGQTANMHKIFRKLFNFLSQRFSLIYFGLEKSGAFIEHAIEISRTEKNKFYLKKGHALLLSNEYIYRYVTPGDSKTMLYGSTSYYGGKVIIHTDDGQLFVVSVPTKSADVIVDPKKEDYLNIDIVVSVLKRLKCDMYNDTVIPVAIANKLIALTGHPSQSILEKYASEAMQRA